MADRSDPVTGPRHAADRALDLVRDRTARPVTGAAQAAAIRQRIRIPLHFADGYSATATVVSFTGLSDAQQHVALELGRPAAARLPLVRLHSECLTGDVFGSQRCDCGPQLREAVERITKHGGNVLYLRQEGRGIGLYDKLDAYALQDGGLDTYDANLALGRGADERDYTSAAQMLHALGADRIALLSNNPDKGTQLARLGITIASRVPTALHLTGANAAYLATKAQRGGHICCRGGLTTLAGRAGPPVRSPVPQTWGSRPDDRRPQASTACHRASRPRSTYDGGHPVDGGVRAPIPAAPRVDPTPAGDVGPATQMEARCVRFARRMKARRMKARCRQLARWFRVRSGSRRSWGCSPQPPCSASCPPPLVSASLAGSPGWPPDRRRRH